MTSRIFSRFTPLAIAVVVVAAPIVWTAGFTGAIGPTISIGAALFALVIGPGYLVLRALGLTEARNILDIYALAFVAGLTLWLPAGALGFAAQTSLAVPIYVVMGIAGLCVAIAVWRARAANTLRYARNHSGKAMLLVMIAFALGAGFVGNFRGVWERWDYFTYISFVRRILSEIALTPAHAWYAGEALDPIHSYDVLALMWAAVCRVAHADPIVVYVASAPFTMAAAAASFRFLVRALTRNARIADIGTIFIIAYHVAYGGFVFIGRTALYPDDTIMFIVYPVVVGVMFNTMRGRRRRAAECAVGLMIAFASLVHVLWGVLLVITVGLLGICTVAAHTRMRKGSASLERRDRWFLWLGGLLAAPPYIIGLGAIGFGSREQLAHAVAETPIVAGEFAVAMALVCVVIPVIIVGVIAWKHRDAYQLTSVGRARLSRFAWLALSTGVLVLPIVALRAQTVAGVVESFLNKHPYRYFITSDLFILNPIGPTYGSPNMTLFPLFFIGFIALPYAWRRGRVGRPAWLLAAAGLVLAPVITTHPVLASVWADLVSLGYLRRLLRFGALWGAVLTSVMFARWVQAHWGARRPFTRFAVAIGSAVAFNAAVIPWTIESPPYYNRLFERMVAVVRHTPRHALPGAEPMFRWIRERVAPGSVVMADAWTSYQLTAYAPVFVVARFKGGTGVASQQRRRDAQHTFFISETAHDTRRRILDEFHAGYVLVNVNTGYTSRGKTFAFPDIARALADERVHFLPIHATADFVLFRYYSAGTSAAATDVPVRRP